MVLPGQLLKCYLSRALDKASSLIQNVWNIQISRHMCIGYSLEIAGRGTSKEYSKHMFSRLAKKTNIYLKTP